MLTTRYLASKGCEKQGVSPKGKDTKKHSKTKHGIFGLLNNYPY